MPGLYFAIYWKVNSGYWAVPDIVVSLAVPNKVATVLLQLDSNDLFKLSHYEICILLSDATKRLIGLDSLFISTSSGTAFLTL